MKTTDHFIPLFLSFSFVLNSLTIHTHSHTLTPMDRNRIKLSYNTDSSYQHNTHAADWFNDQHIHSQKQQQTEIKTAQINAHTNAYTSTLTRAKQIIDKYTTYNYTPTTIIFITHIINHSAHFFYLKMKIIMIIIILSRFTDYTQITQLNTTHHRQVGRQITRKKNYQQKHYQHIIEQSIHIIYYSHERQKVQPAEAVPYNLLNRSHRKFCCFLFYTLNYQPHWLLYEWIVVAK